MSMAQHKYNLLVIVPREGEFAGFSKAFKLAIGGGNLIQGRCAGALRVIAITMLAIESSDRFD
jgi:hypothetical protein